MKPTFVLLALAPSLFAIELKPGNEGIRVNAGALGGFSFAYPTLTTQSNKEIKLIEARPTGASASLKYTGGTAIEVTTSSDGTVTYTFSGLPADVKSLSTSTLVDISFGRGGRWKSGDKEGVFPREKATPPHFFSVNGNHITISNPAGDALDLRIPDYSFIQLTDNRE